MELTLTPIGIVKSRAQTVTDRMDYSAEARVALQPELAPALIGIENFSHLWVLYHQHQSTAWKLSHGWQAEPTLINPPADDRSGQGIYTCRAPVRPNALGSCVVSLLRREGSELIVRGLDAIDGSPVVDLKVYVPQFDAFPGATTPLHWARVLSDAEDLARGARLFHWETTNVDFALGFRAGLICLKRLAAARHEALQAALAGSLFFAQGFEAATGCSALRNSLAWVEQSRAELPWRARLQTAQSALALALFHLEWPDAGAVMSAEEEQVFAPADSSPPPPPGSIRQFCPKDSVPGHLQK